MSERVFSVSQEALYNGDADIENRFFDGDKFNGARFVDELLNCYPQGYFITPINEQGGSVIWMYTEEKGIYEPLGIPWIENRLKRILEENIKKSYYGDVVKHLEVETYTDPAEFFEEHPEVIVFKNGTYNLITDTLEPHNHIYKAKSRVPHNYNPNAKCPNIVKTLVEIIGEDIATFQEWLGYQLYRKYPIHKCALYIGTGKNGKTQILVLISYLVGRENTSSVSLYELTSDKFAAADLHGKLSNLAPDVGETELKHTGRFKALTGEDPIRAQKKYQDAFEFYNYAKINLACNQVPETPDNSDAFFRRFLPFKLKTKFMDKSTLDALPGLREKPNIKQKTPRIMDQICTPEELEGLTIWALKGLKRLLRQGEFTKAPSTEEVREFWITQSNPVLGFVNKHVTEDPDAETPIDEVYKAYVEYCRRNGQIPDPKNVFSTKLSGEATYTKTRPRIGEDRVNCYRGIKITGFGHDGHDGQGGNKKSFTGSHHKKGKKHPDHPDHPDQKHLTEVIE